MLTDQIADMFTRIRNAIKARKRTVNVPASNIKKEITRILFENHFISKYAYVDDGKQGIIKILLKYDEQMQSAIQGIKKVRSCLKIISSANTPMSTTGNRGSSRSCSNTMSRCRTLFRGLKK